MKKDVWINHTTYFETLWGKFSDNWGEKIRGNSVLAPTPTPAANKIKKILKPHSQVFELKEYVTCSGF